MLIVGGSVQKEKICHGKVVGKLLHFGLLCEFKVPVMHGGITEQPFQPDGVDGDVFYIGVEILSKFFHFFPAPNNYVNE